MTEINVLSAARTRLLQGERTTLAGALTEKPDDDMVTALIEDTYLRLGAGAVSSLNAVEFEIAERLDSGDEYPVGNEEAFQGVMWLAQTDPASLPTTMPRDFALYFAMAWKAQGRFATVTEALQYACDNFTFS